MDHQNNYGSVTITYTYNNQTYIVSGKFTQNGNDGYIANISDSNFPPIDSNKFVGGIIIQLTIERNNEITINNVEFCKNYNLNGIPDFTTSPVTNVNF